MANELLRFRKGLAANLPSTNAPGTIYVTTDERAMYVDIDASTRIRLGDFVVVADLTELAKMPTHSTTALYYVVSENALARYNGEKWIQINDTAALETAITALENKVGSAKNGDVAATGLFADIEAINSDIAEIEEQIKALTGGEGEDVTSIAGLAARLVTAEGDINALEEVVGNADSGLVKSVAGIDTRLTNAENTLSAVPGNIASAVKALEDGKVAANTTAINGLKEQMGEGKVDDRIASAIAPLAKASDVKATTDGLDSRLTVAENKLAPIVADATHEGSLAHTATRVTTLEGDVADLEAAVEAANKKHADELKAHEETAAATYATKTTVSGIDTRVTTAENAIAALTSGDNSVDSKIESAIEDLQGETTATIKSVEDKADSALAKIGTVAEGKTVSGLISEVDTKAGNNATAISGLDTRVTANENDIKDLKDADSALETKIGTDIAAAKSALETKMAQDIAASAAATKTAYEAADSALDTKIGGLDTRVTALENAKPVIEKGISDNAAAIEKLNGAVTVEGSVAHSIAKALQTADAMTYKGVVNAFENLPTDPAKGDVYKVATAGNYGNVGYCKVGDLLIANSEDPEVDGKIVTGLVWDLVPSGGEDDTNPTLSVADNTIKLTGAANEELGAVTFEGSDIVSVSTTDSKVQIDLVWGSF